MNRAILPTGTVNVPATWNELTPAQVLRAVHVLFTPASEADLQARLICVLLNLWKHPRRAWLFIRMAWLDIEQFRRLTHFLIHEQARLCVQKFPRLRVRWWRRPWYGPGDVLQGLTFTEWIDAEAALFRFRQTQDVQHLNRLVAVLYRPGRQAPDASTGDRRPPYAQHELAARTLLAGQLPLDVRRAILMYYDGCRQVYIEQFPEVFDGTADDDPEQAPRAPENPGPAYMRILRELAASPEKFDIIGRQSIGNILFDLSERVKHAAELADAKNDPQP